MTTSSTGPYNSRANEPWRTYSGMFWSGGLSAQHATEIQNYNMNNEKLSRMGIWSGGGDFDNKLIAFTEQGPVYQQINKNKSAHRSDCRNVSEGADAPPP